MQLRSYINAFRVSLQTILGELYLESLLSSKIYCHYSVNLYETFRLKIINTLAPFDNKRKIVGKIINLCEQSKNKF